MKPRTTRLPAQTRAPRRSGNSVKPQNLTDAMVWEVAKAAADHKDKVLLGLCAVVLRARAGGGVKRARKVLCKGINASLNAIRREGDPVKRPREDAPIKRPRKIHLEDGSCKRGESNEQLPHQKFIEADNEACLACARICGCADCHELQRAFGTQKK